MLDWSDRGTCVLFGDGAGAVVLKADSETGILSTHLHADGGKKELLWNPVGVSVGFKPEEHNAGVKVLMIGNEVFKHAVKALDAVVEETLAANGLDRHDIDWLIPHQANLRIIEATAKRLDMPMERVVVTVDKHGNTSSGSVPLALDVAVRSGKVAARPTAAARGLRWRFHLGLGAAALLSARRGVSRSCKCARGDIRAGTDDPRTLPVSFAPPSPHSAGNRR